MTQYGGNALSGPNYLVKNGALAVPSDYVGMHFRAWPLFNSAYWAASGQPFPTQAAPAPTNMAFGSWRSHDSGYCFWNQIELTANTYSWANVDTLISTHKAAGRTVMFCFTGVPNFWLSPSNPNYNTPSSGATYPDATGGLAAAGNFITALITRYNTSTGGWASQTNGSGTNWSVYGKGINTLELWNEPSFFGAGGSFWVGTVGQLVDLLYTARNAAKAVDSALVVASPGWAASNAMQSFLQGSGTINTGVTGLSLCDQLDIHIYQRCPPCDKFGSWVVNPANASLSCDVLDDNANWISIAKTCGAGSLAVYATECGIDYNAGTPELNAINAQNPQWRYNWWARQMLTGAALGYKKWMTYSWDTPYACYPDNDPTGVAQAVNDVHVNVAGKTIKNAYYYAGGPFTLTFIDGTSFTV